MPSKEKMLTHLLQTPACAMQKKEIQKTENKKQAIILQFCTVLNVANCSELETEFQMMSCKTKAK